MEKGFYIGNTGHIRNRQNFKILFWSWESEKADSSNFPEIFTRKIWNTGISSETTIPGISSETTETRDPLVHVVTDFPFYGFFNQLAEPGLSAASNLSS